MKKKILFGLLAMVLVLGLAFLGCSNPSSNSTVDDPLVLKDTVNKKVVEITISRTNPSKAVLTPKVGDYYVIKLDGVVISKGTLTQVNNGEITFTPSADSPGANKTAFTGTLSSAGNLSIPSIPYSGGTITGIVANSSGGSGSGNVSNGNGGGGNGNGSGSGNDSSSGNSSGGGDPTPTAKTIVITLGDDALRAFLLAGDVMIMVGNDDIGEGGGIGVVNASSTSVTFDLYNFTWDNNEFTPSTPWTGSGSCNMFLQNSDSYGVYYVYSNGHEIDVYDEDAEKISISDATTTIASSKFAEYDHVYDQNNPNAKTLTVTDMTVGTPELTAAAQIELYRRIVNGDGYSPASTPVAKANAATVNADNSVTFTLMKGWKNEPWKGAGWVFIKVTEGTKEYWYVDHTKLPNPVSTDETFCFTNNTGSHSITMADLYLQP
jgi:hypothetical protein